MIVAFFVLIGLARFGVRKWQTIGTRRNFVKFLESSFDLSWSAHLIRYVCQGSTLA